MAFKCIDLTALTNNIHSQFPGVSHHNSKVLVGVDGARNVSVVVAEFIERHDAILYLGVPQRHELLIGLFGSQFLVDHIGVHAHVVQLGYIIQSHLSVFVNIKFVIGLSDHANTGRTQVPSKNADELVERNGATVITIKCSKEGFSLVLVEVDAEVF